MSPPDPRDPKLVEDPRLEYGLEASMRSKRNFLRDQFFLGLFCGLGGDPGSTHCGHSGSTHCGHMQGLEGRLEVLL